MADDQPDDIRQHMISVARAKFLAEDYDVFADLSIADVAESAHVSVRHARRLFTADSFREAMVDELLRVHPEDDLTPEEFEDFTERIVDETKPLIDEMGDIVSYIYEHNIQNPTMRALLALWSLPPDSSLTQRKIVDVYLRFLKDARNGLNAMLIGRSEALPLREDRISVDDFVRTMTALLEGLAIQERPHRLLETSGEPFDFPAGIAPMDPELPRRILEIISVSYTHLTLPTKA